MQDHGEEVRNWAQERDRIDRGAAGDKIQAEDPAIAPLGTDAEAAGAITPARHIDRSARLQGAGGPERAAATGQPRGRSRRTGLLIFVALVVIAVISAMLMFR
jgi:hypothetical protein